MGCFSFFGGDVENNDKRGCGVKGEKKVESFWHHGGLGWWERDKDRGTYCYKKDTFFSHWFETKVMEAR